MGKRRKVFVIGPVLRAVGDHLRRHLTRTAQARLLYAMTATLSPDGNILLPAELRTSAHLLPGDTLDVQIYKGTIVLRKHQPLTADQCAALLEQSRSQPQPTPEDDASVDQAIREARAARR